MGSNVTIKGATVVTPTGVALLDIKVRDGVVAELLVPGEASPESPGEEVIDATGLVAVPGGVDPHVHTNLELPMQLESIASGPDLVGRAAAYGGTTTLMDFAGWEPPGTLMDALVGKVAEWDQISPVDYAFHMTFRRGRIPTSVLDEIPQAIEAGQPSFKVWTTNGTPARALTAAYKSDMGDVWTLMRRLKDAGGLLCVHAEDDDIVMFAYEEHRASGEWSFDHMPEVHNKASEAASFARVIALAEYTGAALYFMHVSAAEGVEAIRRAKERGLPVYGETLQQYSYFTAKNYEEEFGQIYHTNPSLKYDEDVDALWDGQLDGTISTIATDEACTSFAVKTHGKTVEDIVGGHVGVEVRMAVAYTEVVQKRGQSLGTFVALTSANAARIMGMYPKKGVIAVGSDADIALLRVAPRTIRLPDLHESDYTAWEGYEAAAWPYLTMLRGEVLVRDGEYVGPPAGGKIVERRIAPHVLTPSRRTFAI